MDLIFVLQNYWHKIKIPLGSVTHNKQTKWWNYNQVFQLSVFVSSLMPTCYQQTSLYTSTVDISFKYLLLDAFECYAIIYFSCWDYYWKLFMNNKNSLDNTEKLMHTANTDPNLLNLQNTSDVYKTTTWKKAATSTQQSVPFWVICFRCIISLCHQNLRSQSTIVNSVPMSQWSTLCLRSTCYSIRYQATNQTKWSTSEHQDWRKNQNLVS